MCRALILDSDQRERRFVAAIASTRCDKVEEVSTMRAAARALKRKRRHPNVVVATVEGIWKDRRNIPELLRASGVRIPFVLIVAKAAEALISEVRELGLRNLVHRPLRSEDLARALREATDSGPSPPAGAPPLTEEERHSNLSDLVDHFNATMKCPVGKGQVFLHSFIADRGRKTEPRVTLRCHLRAKLGRDPYCYYEHIRDVCCAAPHECPALRTFAAKSGQHFPELEHQQRGVGS